MSTEKDAPQSGESRELSADEEEILSVLKRLSKIIKEREERQTINFEDFEKCLDVFGFRPSGGFLLFAVPPSEIESIIEFAIENNLADLPTKEELMQYLSRRVIQIIPKDELKQLIYVDFPIEKPTYDLVEKREQAEKLKKIFVKAEWIGEIINEAIENFDDEFERFISLAQSRRVLREQVWKLCSGSFENRRRAITFIINAIERSRAKDITIPQLKLIRGAVLSLAQDDINIDEIGDISKVAWKSDS